MKNTHSLEQLIVIAAETFQIEKYADVKTVYVSEDGFSFVEENRAKIHCRSIDGLKYHTITRTDALGSAVEAAVEKVADVQAAKENLQQTLPAGDATQGKSENSNPDDAALLLLKAKYQELFGKAAHHNIGAEKLTDLIAQKEAELKAAQQTNQNPE